MSRMGTDLMSTDLFQEFAGRLLGLRPKNRRLVVNHRARRPGAIKCPYSYAARRPPAVSRRRLLSSRSAENTSAPTRGPATTTARMD